MKTRRKSLSVLALVTAGSFAAVACGTTGAGHGEITNTKSRVADSSPVVGGDGTGVGADVRSTADAVYKSFAGTEREQNAGLVLQSYALNGATSRCMASAGFDDWDWSLSRAYAEPKDALAATVWFAAPLYPYKSQQLIALAPFKRAEVVMNADEGSSAEREAAITQCLKTTPGTSDDAADAAAKPAAAAALEEDWRAALASAGSSLGGDPMKYNDCMNAAKIPILDERGIDAGDVEEALQTVVPSAKDIPDSASDPVANSAGWQHLLQVEGTVVQADWSCRKSTYEEGIEKLGPLIKDFETKHAQEIKQAQQGWQDIEDQAAKLGYSGQVGPLHTKQD
jgi:hypothetical protein